MPSPIDQPVQLLSDYRPYPFLLSETRLDVTLDPHATEVAAAIDMTPREGKEDLILDGGKGLELLSLSIDGTRPDDRHVTRDDEKLVIAAAALPEGPFTLETRVRIDPAANTAFEGLYLSGGIFCTQCEAEGFRHITFYPDRPDVMTTFRVTIRSDKPVLLSNGNPVRQEPGLAEWHDPWPKPCYLFALVAGDLTAVSDGFTTKSGRDVALNVWVRPGDQDRAGFAMESLIKSMRWDEDVYGREYDLDVFNIVAVDDFNMGAMENKGLNIFNSKLVLASPETATDTDYERIEAVIAHEYFHNWTGNRITCRDWFQLCLKEGLTVFRDQQFTSDMRSAPVKRIEDVRTLRARQFREDQGPLAHPPRPDRYEEINNFYTATVYEKGAEVIGMLKRLVGEDGYAKALDLYFARHDGDAATIEDWLKVFEDATGRDLSQFKRWYTDAGTPRLTMTEEWSDGRLTLRFAQSTAPTPGQPDKPARVIPIAVGLIGPNGDEVLPTRILEMTEAEQSFSFDDLGARPVVSVLRGFSAPVMLERQIDDATRAFLLAHDTDPFARWEAGRELALSALTRLSQGQESGADYVEAIGALAADRSADPAFRALCLALPSEEEIATRLAAQGAIPDPDAIHAARDGLAHRIAVTHQDLLADIFEAMEVTGPYSPDADGAARRALRLAALGLLGRIDNGERAQVLFGAAGNMTERMGALSVLLRQGRGQAALDAMLAEFGGNRLVMDKWFAVQPMSAPPEHAAEVAKTLAARDDFDWKNPNRFRSLIGGLAANHAGFHAADGSGYDFTADWLIRMDEVNPQIAARMSTAFETWPRYDDGRRAHALAALERIAARRGLSRNTREMVSRMIAAGA
ncbi:aminopeptidase N [Paracoccus sp. 1_MG-2023]|uniref:aminopeptidase N n=1 Tax=unclassified Paracoccus (in: a-proteobacteria) TaxID=2688777 RepID=UPI001C093EC4|nr:MULTISPECIES: aminopeptidase N [unclassified Paracoccus (in: a-proteobacteria)]MBU2958807.1 aminopeptidase N [Paracoccus sp. C2R09]MDO6667800.1 aminopeptidase N [Paracoccus sp. 1_MG-2023]